MPSWRRIDRIDHPEVNHHEVFRREIPSRTLEYQITYTNRSCFKFEIPIYELRSYLINVNLRVPKHPDLVNTDVEIVANFAGLKTLLKMKTEELGEELIIFPVDDQSIHCDFPDYPNERLSITLFSQASEEVVKIHGDFRCYLFLNYANPS